jgi:hypothetical protein
MSTNISKGSSMNYKPVFHFGLARHTNGQTFATHDEAISSASARFAVWTAPTDYSAMETTDPVTYKRVDGRDVRITKA